MALFAVGLDGMGPSREKRSPASYTTQLQIVKNRL